MNWNPGTPTEQLRAQVADSVRWLAFLVKRMRLARENNEDETTVMLKADYHGRKALRNAAEVCFYAGGESVALRDHLIETAQGFQRLINGEDAA